MKIFQGLLMISILMIGFTSKASTPLMEQEPKATIKLDQSVSFDVVNVEKFSFVAIEALTMQTSTVYACSFTKNADVIFNPLTHLDDVGWTDLIKNYHLNFKSKLSEVNRIPIKSKDVIRIRNDS